MGRELDWARTVDARDPLPLHAQLERSIRVAIAAGRLKTGDQLPTVRELAVALKINANTGQVVVGPENLLYSHRLVARQVNLIAVEDLDCPMRVGVKIRHRHEPAPAVIEKSANDEIVVRFDDPQRAVTPGQAAVFYDGEVVVGGGWISAT